LAAPPASDGGKQSDRQQAADGESGRGRGHGVGIVRGRWADR
jgi:hypothetical protein